MAVVLSDEQDRILADIFRMYREGRLGVTSTRGREPSIVDAPSFIGKPATNFAQGALSSPDNVVDMWQGPGFTSDEDIGVPMEVHYARQAVTTADYVLCINVGGKFYVEKLTC